MFQWSYLSRALNLWMRIHSYQCLKTWNIFAHWVVYISRYFCTPEIRFNLMDHCKYGVSVRPNKNGKPALIESDFIFKTEPCSSFDLRPKYDKWRQTRASMSCFINVKLHTWRVAIQYAPYEYRRLRFVGVSCGHTMYNLRLSADSWYQFCRAASLVFE